MATVIVDGNKHEVEVKEYYGEIIASKVHKLPFGADENLFSLSQSHEDNGNLPVLITEQATQ